MNDSYRVRLEIKQTLMSDGRIDTTYRIKEVLEYRPAPEHMQQALDYDGPNPDDDS